MTKSLTIQQAIELQTAIESLDRLPLTIAYAIRLRLAANLAALTIVTAPYVKLKTQLVRKYCPIPNEAGQYKVPPASTDAYNAEHDPMLQETRDVKIIEIHPNDLCPTPGKEEKENQIPNIVLKGLMPMFRDSTMPAS